jgi:hypothetical protein
MQSLKRQMVYCLCTSASPATLEPTLHSVLPCTHIYRVDYAGGVLVALKLEARTHLGTIDLRVAEADRRLMAENATRSFFIKISEFGSGLTKTLGREEIANDVHANAVFAGGAVRAGVKTWTPVAAVDRVAATGAMATAVDKGSITTKTVPTATYDHTTLAKRFKEDETRYKKTIDGYLDREQEFKHKLQQGVALQARNQVLETKVLTRDKALAAANARIHDLERELDEAQWRLAAGGGDDALVARFKAGLTEEHRQEVVKLQAEFNASVAAVRHLTGALDAADRKYNEMYKRLSSSVGVGFFSFSMVYSHTLIPAQQNGERVRCLHAHQQGQSGRVRCCGALLFFFFFLLHSSDNHVGRNSTCSVRSPTPVV